MAFYDYQIASGFNQAGSLVNVETLQDSNGVYFFAPRVLGSHDVPLIPTVSNNVIQQGYEVVTWLWVLRSLQYKKLRTDYCGGGYSGNVTIRTITDTIGTYANYNAVMRMPAPVNTDNVSDSYTVAVRMVLTETL